MNVSPDTSILWHAGPLALNVTIVMTWIVMAFLCIASVLITHRLTGDVLVSRWQSGVEIVVTTMLQQMRDIGLRDPARYLGFLGTLFLLIAVSNLCAIVPGFVPPTSSLSTTAALAITVFVAVPVFGIRERGLRRYLASYTEPTVLMLPFNMLSELTRTLALAVRLFGNMMSGTMILGILLTIAPFFFPVIMSVLGLLTGMVQAYIFSILAAVYIAAATRRGARDATPPRAATPSPTPGASRDG